MNTEAKPKTRLQDICLNQLRKEKQKVSIFLISGVKLEGAVLSFDEYVLLIPNPVDGSDQIVYKSAIMTIVPSGKHKFALEGFIPTVKSDAKLQDAYLSQLSEKRLSVSMFLRNGVNLRGVITAFDQYVLILERQGQQQIIYKSAIGTISPMDKNRFDLQKLSRE